MADQSKWLNVEERDDLLLVQLTRPEKRNAINDTLLLSLEAVFSTVPEGVKCAVLYAEGPHFSAGLDLSELQERDVIEGLHHSRMWHRVLDRIQFGTVPVVAVLKGACVGGGLEIASACHIRVAEQSTFYALPEGQRGIFVGGGASVRLPKLIGMARMADMMFTGRVISADEGIWMGLSQYLALDGDGLTKGIELATKIAQNAPMTNYALMHVLPRIADSTQSEGLLLESLMATIAQSSPEAKQRLRDFLEGRAKKVGE
ncbi:crotonase/enoyl-CoA hydratase family protein [Spirosoma sp. KCTC 42546]|uniref:crotonase/enoyl-CoA hydratase family protein n=1 Tax=Spirosoma sp. KCTC 42546 TaxID=2520506 RepID=UPI00115B1278|nr:crotonase/enoyl-CoA hydratase family protein [Spirosoma sp. KCTC 42546]QDK77197.1 crotonase/enoyl-CoA hydratase family protein [Spirosoma sp. KCTC 42546]